MGKARTAPKKKYETIMIDMDVDVIEALEGVAKLCDLTPSQVVSVYLATVVVNSKTCKCKHAKKIPYGGTGY